MQPLTTCGLKEVAVIQYIEDCEMKRRLLDLGFVSGAQVIPVLESPSKGMRAYFIKGCKIGIRDSVSIKIFVEKGGLNAV